MCVRYCVVYYTVGLQYSRTFLCDHERGSTSQYFVAITSQYNYTRFKIRKHQYVVLIRRIYGDSALARRGVDTFQTSYGHCQYLT